MFIYWSRFPVYHESRLFEQLGVVPGMTLLRTGEPHSPVLQVRDADIIDPKDLSAWLLNRMTVLFFFHNGLPVTVQFIH